MDTRLPLLYRVQRLSECSLHRHMHSLYNMRVYKLKFSDDNHGPPNLCTWHGRRPEESRPRTSNLKICKVLSKLEIWQWKYNTQIKLICSTSNKNLAIANRSRVSCINTNNNNTMTLKSGFEVTQGHWKWYYLKAWVRFPIRLLYGRICSRLWYI